MPFKKLPVIPDKEPMIDSFRRAVYSDSRHGVRLPGMPFCPCCRAEQAHLLYDDGDRRLLACMNCGQWYQGFKRKVA